MDDLPVCRLHLDLCEGPAMEWRGRFDPPLLDAAAADTLTVGQWHAPTSTAAQLQEEGGAQDLGIDVSVRFLSQLRHALLHEPGEVLPVSFHRELELGAIVAGLDKDELARTIEATEEAHGLGLRTRHFSPPVYLQYFWGHPPRGRAYGRLDSMIARMAHFDIVPAALVERARDPTSADDWAVVVPDGLPDKDRILDALAPLVARRGGTVMTLPDGHDPASIDTFVADLSRMPLERRPYFLLLVGGLDELGVEFQYFLQSFGAAGRLHFDAIEDYRRYADKVLRHEAALGGAPPAAAFVATDTDDVAAVNAEELVRPLSQEIVAGGAPILLDEGRATKARVLELAGDLPERSILFLAGHGHEQGPVEGYDEDDLVADQLSFEGALILDDFPGRRSLGDARGLLCAADLDAGRPFVPGGVVILHACHSAATVVRDTLPEWIHLPAPPRRRPRRPFVSRLSQALLASPSGPVAVYGHVNRSHQYAWYDPEGSGESLTLRVYRDLLSALTAGDPIGIGRERARRETIRYMDQAITISHQIEWLLTGRSRGGSGIGWPRKGVEAYERSFVQYSFGSCNFRNYLILGDPMVRLRRSPPAAEGRSGQ